MTARPTRILMICTGNICRSPLAECVLRHKAVRRGAKERVEVDSAGIGDWHAGEAPDHRVRAVAELNGVTMTGSARQVTRHDIRQFDLLVCMDHTHRSHLLGMGADEDKARLLLDFDPHSPVSDVPDPYYGGIEGFHAIYRMIDRACDHLLDHVLEGAAGSA
jgi:protein-tyrosine phosphatase